MACCSSSQSREEKARSLAIEQQLEVERRNITVKLLLLGAGESGKSTIVKQMRIIHLKGFTEEDKIAYKPAIFSNTLGSIQALVLATDKLHININESSQEAKKRVMEEDFHHAAITKTLARDIKILWSDPGIKQALSRSSEFQLNDSAEYYLSDIDRLSEDSYIPTVQDILRSRVKTTGIIETEFFVNKTRFLLVDVGGQRSERRKWLNCFSDVTAVIFVVAMSAYDQKLYEDETTNRMQEELRLFKDICNSKWFTETAIILFLNKKDLFEKKIQKVPLTTCFPTYTGPNKYNEASQFIIEQFLQQNENPRKLIYTHHTCATDTDQITVVFRAVQDIILTKVLNQSSTA